MSDKYAVPNKLPAKQVNVLAHRKRRLLQDKNVVKQKRHQRIRRFAKKKRNFVRAEAFIMEQIKARRTQNRTRQILLRRNILKDEKTNKKLLIVFRHAGKHIADETTTNIFKALRMTSRHAAVFLKNNKENQILLKCIEPYVIYGYPTLTTIRELIFKKGFAMVNGKKTAIQSNTMVEEQLGTTGVICIEDLIHEIFTVGSNFDVVAQFLCPFALKGPKDGWKRKVSISYAKGGEYGNRKEAVNSVIERCL